MFLTKKLNFRYLRNNINLIVNSFPKINFINQNKHFKSNMENITIPKEQEELTKLLSELNIHETNMPNVPKKTQRYQRYFIDINKTISNFSLYSWKYI